MLFSVIVPVYNVEKYLEKCVNSILRQTCTDFEAILVDDGSKDGCPAMCDRFAAQDGRVRVIHKPNGGLVSARNAGVMQARGDYICYVDGDDWADENMLEFVRGKLAESPVPLDMVMFAAHNVFADHTEKTVNEVTEGYYDRERLEKDVYPYLFSDRRNGFRMGHTVFAHTWDKVCRRELQLDHYVRDERIRMLTDVPVTYECILNSRNVYICNELLYFYNKTNEQSIRARGKENFLTKNSYYLNTYLRSRLSGYSPDIDRQLNDYPVTMIIRTAMVALEETQSFFRAKGTVRRGLNESGLLKLVSLKGLPTNPRVLMTLFRLHLDTLAMLLCGIKVREAAWKKKEG